MRGVSTRRDPFKHPRPGDAIGTHRIARIVISSDLVRSLMTQSEYLQIVYIEAKLGGRHANKMTDTCTLQQWREWADKVRARVIEAVR